MIIIIIRKQTRQNKGSVKIINTQIITINLTTKTPWSSQLSKKDPKKTSYSSHKFRRSKTRSQGKKATYMLTSNPTTLLLTRRTIISQPGKTLIRRRSEFTRTTRQYKPPRGKRTPKSSKSPPREQWKTTSDICTELLQHSSSSSGLTPDVNGRASISSATSSKVFT